MTVSEGKPLNRGLVITVSGVHGSGRSTHAKILAETFDLRYVSSGTIFRQMAEERGITIKDMSKLTEENPDFDKLIDERTRAETEKGGVVIDATLSGWIAQAPDIRIFFTTPIEARIRRIALREGISPKVAREETLVRETSERERFMNYYGIDITDLSIYDVVLNTELFEPAGTARILKRIVEEYCAGR